MATTRATVDAWYDPPAPYGRNVQLLRLAVMVGILGALAVLAFHQLPLALEAALYGSNHGLVADATRLQPEIRTIIPALGGLAAGLVLQYFLGRGKGETGADYMEAIAADGEVPWRSSLLKSAAFGFDQAVFALMALGQTIELDGHRGQMEPVSAS